MKKIIIFLILAMVFAVSCGGSKKTENDTDILPDEDVINNEEADLDDEVNVDEDKTDDEEPDEDADYDEDNPCNPNPCEGLERTTGECIASYDSEYDYSYYSCVCEDRYKYYWDYFEAKCTNACEGNPCANKEHSNGHCSLFDTPAAYECGCVEGYHWEYFDCVKDKNTCDNPENPCAGMANSTERCISTINNSYSCECIEEYFWDGKECVKNPCKNVSCENFEHALGKCKPVNTSTYTCDCDNGYFWWNKEGGCIAKKTGAANVCTGQTKCYDNEKEILCPAENEDFFGQDAQYAALGFCVPQSFSIDETIPGEPVVVDNNTGMMWQQNIPPLEQLYIEDVQHYCSSLVYGGYNDWRLPSVAEFITITDFGRYSPAINTGYFPDYGSFWTATNKVTGYGEGADSHAYASSEHYYSVFDFAEPSASFILTSTYDNFNTSYTQSYAASYNIRCVRGDKILSKAFISKMFGENLTWNYDSDLILLQTKETKQTWIEALKYCSELDYAGISDWRLPNIRELYLASDEGIHSSTTKMSDPSSAYSGKSVDNWFPTDNLFAYKNSKEGIICVANDPCESGRFWNGEKCSKNPCSKDPCRSDSNSNGTCTVLDEENYSCNCNKNYKWSPEKLQCVRTCQDNPCNSYSNSDKQCYDDDVEGFYCGCIEPYFWNANSRKCTQNCDHNPCLDEANSTHECFPDEKNGYTCGCNDGYVWLRLDGCVTDFCKLDSCKNIPNSNGECRIVEEFGYLCECLNGTLWNPIEKNCGDEGFSFDWGTE